MHEHHVTPRYLYPDSKITVSVTVIQHAMFHYCNWQLWRNKEDFIAWKSLAGQMGKEEVQRELSALGGKRNAGKSKTGEHKTKIAKAITGKKHSSSVKKKISTSMTGNTNSHGQKSVESRKKHSEIMKAAWARRKAKSGT